MTSTAYPSFWKYLFYYQTFSSLNNITVSTEFVFLPDLGPCNISAVLHIMHMFMHVFYSCFILYEQVFFPVCGYLPANGFTARERERESD